MSEGRFRQWVLLILATMLVVVAWGIWSWRHSASEKERLEFEATEQAYKDLAERDARK